MGGAARTPAVSLRTDIGRTGIGRTGIGRTGMRKNQEAT